MLTVYVDDIPIAVDPNNPSGEGGEGLTFEMTGHKIPGIPASAMLKVYRGANDPIYISPGNLEQTKRNQMGAVRRIAAHQKKLPAFPKALPERVVGPSKLVWNHKSGTVVGGKPAKRRVVGYIMPFIKGNVMSDFADIDFRERQKIDNNFIRDIHLDWLKTIELCHPKGLVFGDVNNNNQIVTPDGKVYIIDADAAQWPDGKGKIFFCETFTPRFVDPLICKPDEMVMTRSHTKETDLYAFDLIFWLTTLYVSPWDGTLPLKTKDPKVAGIPQSKRALKRVSAMHTDVKYPAWATHFSNLPDDVLHHYDELLHKDVRGKSMRKLLEDLRWTTCTSCGHYHARSKCTKCTAQAPSAITVATITRDLMIEKVVDLGGTKLLSVCIQDNRIRYLYHKDGEFHREFGPIGLKRDIERDLDFAISGDRTIISMNGQTAKFAPGERASRIQAEQFRGKSPQFAANKDFYYYLRNGQLIRESSSLEGTYVDETLANQTLLWVGENFGLSFYAVSGIQKLKTFGKDSAGGVNVKNMPDLKGTLKHAKVYFSKDRAWLFTITEEKGVLYNSCFVIRESGECSSSISVEQGDQNHPWLSGFIHLGKCAAVLKSKGQKIETLLSATDDGVVGIMEQKGKLVQAMKFAGTETEVLPTDRLLYEDVLYRIRGGQIHTVKSK